MSATAFAIICTTFGTASQHGQATLQAYHAAVEHRFPQASVHWAFLSQWMRSLRAHAGSPVESLATVLAQCSQEKLSGIVVHPLQIIPGQEYQNIHKTVAAMRHIPKMPECRISASLLWEPASIARLGTALLAEDAQPGPQEQLLYMAHGSPQPAHGLYIALAHWLSWRNPRIFLGSMDHWPTLEELLTRLVPETPRIRLLPLLTLIGTHAQRDMAGSEEGSWSTRLIRAGFSPEPHLVGLLEKPACIELWLQRLQEAAHSLNLNP